jgi:hypothetical protein
MRAIRLFSSITAPYILCAAVWAAELQSVGRPVRILSRGFNPRSLALTGQLTPTIIAPVRPWAGKLAPDP